MIMARIGSNYQAGRVFRDPNIMPRIGDEYQAELPQLTYNPDDPFEDRTRMPRIGDKYQAELPPFGETDTVHDLRFLVGLALPLTCLTTRLDLNIRDPGHILVPGVDEKSWSGAERDCFLLGLYVFEKDFGGIRRFVETKEMGAILSYYYGKFHSSSEYYRWCDCRKTKRFGGRMFCGSRLEELVSRMLPRLVVECRETLLNVSMMFVNGELSLVDYVVSLKAVVGIDILMESVGVCKGRQDLPDCSSFSPSEIIEYLKGDCKLIKGRSSDLFWKAVWPRLRARGWHSERPSNLRNSGGKGNLVFLTPDVKKFDPKNLEKGDQFFDSVTEVLSRVTQDPRLIGLGSEVGPRPSDASSSSNERLSSWVIALPSTSSAGGSRSDSNKDPRPHMSFDLNLPYTDSEDVDFIMELTNEQEVTSQEAEDLDRSLDLEIRVGVNLKKHSTRNRPPTTRFTYDATTEYDPMRRSNKRKEASSDDDQSGPSKRVRSKNEGTDSKQ